MLTNHGIEMQPLPERKAKRENNNVTLLHVPTRKAKRENNNETLPHVPTQPFTDIVWEDMGRCRLIGVIDILQAGHHEKNT